MWVGGNLLPLFCNYATVYLYLTQIYFTPNINIYIYSELVKYLTNIDYIIQLFKKYKKKNRRVSLCYSVAGFERASLLSISTTNTNTNTHIHCNVNLLNLNSVINHFLQTTNHDS